MANRTLSEIEDANEQARHERVQVLTAALRDALTLAAAALDDLDDADRSGDYRDDIEKHTAKLAELRKVLEER